MKKIFKLLCVLMLSLVVGSTTARADAVLDWNAIAVNTAVANKQNPFAQARYAAIVQLAVFEAVNSITHKYQPYLGTITCAAGCLTRCSSDRGCVSGAQYLLSSQPADALCRLDELHAVHTERLSQDRWHRNGRRRSCGHDRAASERRFVTSAVLHIRSTCSRGMAGDTELPGCKWSRGRDRLSMAERNSVRHRERE